MKINETVDAQNQIKGYKKTTYGYIPLDWEIVKLEDISLGKGTYGIGAPAVEYKDNLPRYLRITDIDEQGRLINDEPKCVDNPEAKYYILQKNDIVFARTGNTTGKTYLYKESDGKLVYAGFLIKFSINSDKADPIFIKFFTETNYYWNWVKIMSLRSGQPGINEKEYAKLEIPLPNLNEQRKIASILSTWDKAIELKEKLIEQKKEQKKGLMQKLLTGEVRLPGFKDKWREVKFGEVLKFIKKDKVKNPQNYYLLTVKLHLKGIDSSGKKPNVTRKGRPYYFREPNELLIGRQNFHNGGIGIVPEDMHNHIASNAISSLEAIKGDLKFYYYYLSNPNFYKRVDNLIGGTGQKEISESMMKKLKLLIPTSVEEQKGISKVLEVMDEQIELLERELLQLKLQKKGLMQLLLTGKVRVKV